jgi:hypothetical protein
MSVREAVALRQLFSQFNNTSISDLIATVGQKPSIDVGEFPLSWAKELQDKSVAAGLSAEIVGVEAREP